MMLKDTYLVETFTGRKLDPDIRDIGGGRVNAANVFCTLWGRDVKLSFYFYHLDHGTTITFGIKPVSDRPIDKLFRFAVGSVKTSDRRIIEQEIVMPSFFGEILQLSDLNDAAVPGGRTVSKAFLDTMESMFEIVRLTVLRNLGGETRNHAMKEITKQYGKQTEQVIKTLLSKLHWALLLDGSNCGNQCLGVVKTSLTVNSPRCYGLDHVGQTDIEPKIARPMYYDPSILANMKATMLLEVVCGKSYAEFFKREGYIQTEHNGYKFVLRPGRWIDVEDPCGRKAQLCIHTVNFSCNPIDEVVISWLHIHNHFESWMKTAIVHGADVGFGKEIYKAA